MLAVFFVLAGLSHKVRLSTALARDSPDFDSDVHLLGRPRTQLEYIDTDVSSLPVPSHDTADGTLADSRRLERQRPFIRGDGWEPIRIHVQFVDIEEDSGSRSSVVLKQSVQAAVRYLRTALRVKPVVGNLRFEQACEVYSKITGSCQRVSSWYRKCGTVTIPADHFYDRRVCPDWFDFGCETSAGGAGIPDADFALYVTANAHADGCSGGNTVAFASACLQDQMDRPIAGYLNVCNIWDPDNWNRLMATTLHEIFHALGFATSMFAFFRDDAGNPRTPRDSSGLPPDDGYRYLASEGTIQQVQTWTSERHFIVLPRVVEAARAHYNCTSLARVALEEAGGDGTSFSHWEDRWLYGEVMTPSTSNHPLVSRITMALLEDSGWYRPVYTRAASFAFGRDQGCDFVEKACVVDGATSYTDTFCTRSGGSCSSARSAGGCSFDLMGKAICTNCRHSTALPAEFQYFSDPRLGGTEQYAAYCPIWASYSYCQDASEESSDSTAYGEYFGVNSICIEGTVVSTRYIVPESSYGSCHEVQCHSESLSLRIGTSAWMNCSKDESGTSKPASTAATGFHGTIVCPDFQRVCGHRSLPSKLLLGLDMEEGRTVVAGNVPCLFPGSSISHRCACGPGFAGEDCSLLDRGEAVDEVPFGLSYPGEDWQLEVGLAVDDTASLGAWPVRPRLLSGPSSVRLSMSPQLPDGLSLGEDGTISGTPTRATSRGAYTLRATTVDGTKAATASVYLTVSCGTSNSSGCTLQEPDPPSSTFYFASYSTSGFEWPVYETSRSFLRLNLAVSLATISESSSYSAFSDVAASALSAASRETVRLYQMLQLVNGHTQVNFVVQDSEAKSSTDESFSAAVERLTTSFSDEESQLWKSSFGQQYLQGAAFFEVSTRGVLRIYPEVDESEPTFWSWLWETHDKLILAISVPCCCLFMICCYFCCCRRPKSKAQARAKASAWHGHSRYDARVSPGAEAPSVGLVLQPGPPHQPAADIVGAPLPFTGSGGMGGECQHDKEVAIHQLLEMGFAFQQAESALAANGWDVSAAASHLTTAGSLT